MRAPVSGLLAALLLLAPLGADAGRYLVAAGNNTGLPTEVPLRFAERDAEQFTAVMTRLGGVEAGNVRLLLGKDAATFRRVLIETNERIRAEQDEGRHDSSLFVFYSGHANAEGLHLGGTVLPFVELRGIVAGSASRVRLLILDACRSGGLTQVKGVRPITEFVIEMENRLVPEGLAVITSSAAGEESQESASLGASFFSHHLVNGLRGAADRQGDGKVTLAEVYSYAYQQTLRSSGRTVHLQHPVFDYQLKGKGDFVLTEPGAAAGRSGWIRIPEPGLYLVMEAQESGPVLAELYVSQRGARLNLPAGQYFIQRRARDHYREYRVSLHDQEDTDLGKVEYRKLAYSRLVRKGEGDEAFSHNLYIIGSVRGEVLSGLGVTPQVLLGYAMDFHWFSVGVRARFSYQQGSRPDRSLDIIHMEYGLGLAAYHVVDWSWLSLSVGLLVEGIHIRQDLVAPGSVRDRASWGLAFGGLFSLEFDILPELVLRIEGGPMTLVLRQATNRSGKEIDTELVTPFTWWAGGGVVWRF